MKINNFGTIPSGLLKFKEALEKSLLEVKKALRKDSLVSCEKPYSPYPLDTLKLLTEELGTFGHSKEEYSSFVKVDCLAGELSLFYNFKNDLVADCRGIVKKDTTLAAHVHKEKEFFIMYKGVMHLFVEGETILLKAGDSYYIDPEKVHSAYWPEDSEFIAITIPAAKEFPDDRS